MKFWFVHSSEVSLHEQIATQVSLGIISGDLGRGERLPSIRALAQRFSIHPNTVSAAYRQLERERWVEYRRGSGVFVRDTAPKEIADVKQAVHLDRLILNLLQAARATAVSDAELRARILKHLDKAPPAKLLLIESDVELRRIVLSELAEAITLPPGWATGHADLPHADDTSAIAELTAQLPGSLPLVLPSKAEALRDMLPSSVALHVLRIRSISTLLQPWLPAPSDALVAVASRWPPFLAFARIMLVAAGFDSDALLMRDATQTDWMAGLDQAATVICDCCTATELPQSMRRIKFNLLAEDSIAELKEMTQASRACAQRPGSQDCDT